MTTSVPFLNTPYGGYMHNQLPPADDELTHVGPGTPAGEWLRRFWHPVFVLDELKDLPRAIRILGEDLVLFRDRSGPNRAPGASLLPPGHVAGVRPDPGAGHPLLLPRLALRRGRQAARDAWGAR